VIVLSEVEKKLRVENAALKRQIAELQDAELQDKAKAAAAGETESLYTTLMDNMPTPISLKQVDGRYLYVNKVFAERRGLTLAQLKGKTSNELWPNAPTEHMELRDEALRQTGSSIEVETESLGVDGVQRIYRGIKFPIFGDDGLIAAIGSVHTDITDRKQMEDALAQSEARFRDIVEVASDWVWEMDADFRFTYVSDRVYEMSGFPQGALDGKTRMEVSGQSEWTGEWRAHFEDMESHKNFRNFEYSGQDAEGQTRYFAISGKPVFDNDGVFTGYRGTGSDITELKRMAHENAEKSALLQTIFDAAPVSFSFRDTGGRFVFLNKRLVDDMGGQAEDYIGKTTSEVLGSILGESAEGIVMKVLGSKQPIMDQELRPERRPGQIYRFSVVPVFDDEGAISGALSIGLEVTAQKETEEAVRRNESLLRSVIDNSPAAISLKGLDDRFKLVNKTVLSMHDATEAQMVGELDSVFFTKKHGSVRAEHEQDVLDSGVPVTKERTGALPSGKLVNWLVTKFPLRNEADDITGIGSISVDLTELRQVEENLRAALTDAESANQAKSEFLANMSHELRTPLNAIIGFAETLSDQYFGPLGSDRYIEYSGDIKTSGEHLLQLINDILDVSAIEVGKHRLDIKSTNVPGVVEECVPIISQRANRKGITFTFGTLDHLPQIDADQRALKQILLNILGNAVKFTPSGGAVMLSAAASPDALAFEIRDTGPGIAEDKMDSLTDPFVRGEPDPHKSQEGTGLGLAIVKSLVELHDGELSIDSTLGRGTTVTVTLPRRHI
jgi:PAS domain S-box-containing protein